MAGAESKGGVTSKDGVGEGKKEYYGCYMVRKGFTKEFLLNLIFKNNLKIITYPRGKREHFKEHEEHVQNRQKGKGKSPKSRNIGNTYKMVGNGGRSIQRHCKSPKILKTLLKNLKISPQHMSSRQSEWMLAVNSQLNLTSATQLIINLPLRYAAASEGLTAGECPGL